MLSDLAVTRTSHVVNELVSRTSYCQLCSSFGDSFNLAKVWLSSFQQALLDGNSDDDDFFLRWAWKLEKEKMPFDDCTFLASRCETHRVWWHFLLRSAPFNHWHQEMHGDTPWFYFRCLFLSNKKCCDRDLLFHLLVSLVHSNLLKIRVFKTGCIANTKFQGPVWCNRSKLTFERDFSRGPSARPSRLVNSEGDTRLVQ